MAWRNRKTLKNFFRKGSLPTESNFSDLIDSSLNIVDDGFLKNMDDGFVIAPGAKSERLLTFFNDVEYKNASWSFNMDTTQPEAPFCIKNKENKDVLHLDQSGKAGINTNKPISALEVNGDIAAKGRIGTYAIGEAYADGQWYDILQGLSGCHAFEIVARVGKKDTGKYALLHAIAISTYGRSRSRIRTTQAHFGWFWNKIKLRWRGDTFNYGLQIKTRSDYGAGVKIKFHISRLWDDDMDTLFESEQPAPGDAKQ
jgi:hypothetical protein